MTVSAQTPRNQYTGNGSQTVFSYTFEIVQNADVAVYVNDTLKTLTTDYTVSGAGNNSGGSITFVSAPANGAIVTFRRNMSYARTVDFQTAGPAFASDFNADSDRNVLALQQMQEQINRNVRVGPADSYQGENLEIAENADERAAKIIGFDGNGDVALYDTFLAVPVEISTNALDMIRVNAAGTGYELRTPTQVRSDISAQPVNATLTGLSGLNGSVSADQVIYSTGANTFAMGAFPSYARTLVSQSDATSARSTLGLGSIATHPTTDFVATSTLGAANGTATLDSSGKLTTSQIPTSLVGALQYQGAWNASTNSPTITGGSGTKGQYYVVSVAGTTSIDGHAVWSVGDWIIYNGTAWDIVQGGFSSGEITTALGYTPANKAGDTFSGDISITGTVKPTQYLQGSSTGNRIYLDFANNQIKHYVGTTGFVADISVADTLKVMNLAGTAGGTINASVHTAPAGNMYVQSATNSNLVLNAVGSAAALALQQNSTTRITLDTAGTITASGSLLFSPDGTYDIGTGGATRPRNMFLSAKLQSPFLQTGDSGSTKTVLSMTSAGTQYGTIQVEATGGTGAWSLGYQAASGTTIGTAALTWNGSGQVSIPTSLALNGATIGTDVFAFGSGTATLGALAKIDSSGRLLIGTSSYTMSSSERLEVYGGSSLLDSSSTTVPALYLRNRDATTGGVFQPFIVFSDNSGNRGGISIDATNSQFNTFAQFGFNWYTGVANYTNLRMQISNTGAVSIYNTLAIGGATIGSDALAVTGSTTISSNAVIGGYAQVGTSQEFRFLSRSRIFSPADGKFNFYKWAGGGTGVTLDFSTTDVLKLRNAADTGYGDLYVNNLIAANGLILIGSSRIYESSDGVLRFSNAASTGFTMTQYGGTTSSFPAIKRSAATLAIRLADDSADATLTAKTQTAGDNTTAVATTAFVTAAISASGGGTVSSVQASGGTTGLTFSGGPITSSGTLTLAGTLATANGGTGVTSSTGSGNNVLSASPTLTGTVTAASATLSGSLSVTQVVETYTAPSISAGTLTIDLSAGTVFNVSNSANITTFTISNAVASKVNSFTLILTANGTGYTQAWGASVKWPSGTAPTITTTNTKKDILQFVTNDGGTTWYAGVVGQNY